MGDNAKGRSFSRLFHNATGALGYKLLTVATPIEAATVSKRCSPADGRDYDRAFRSFKPARAISPPPISAILTGSGTPAWPLNE
jgi:hypothetical protein